jgi:hypothetical protein
LADPGYKVLHEQGISENACGYGGQSGGIFRDGLQGRIEKEGIMADTDRFRLEYERKIPDGTGEQNIPPQSERGGIDVADTRCKGIHESGIAEVTGRGNGESGRVYGYGVPGGEEEKRKNMADPGSHGLETPWAAEQSAGLGGCSEKIPDPYILDDDNSGHGTGQICGERSPEAEVSRSVPDTDSQRCQELIDRITAWAGDVDSPSCRNGIGNFWAVEPNVGRVAHGVSSRVDRLKGIGNSVVPQSPQLILEEIKEDFYNDKPWDHEQ